MKKIILLLIYALWMTPMLHAGDVLVRIYSNHTIRQCNFSAVKGAYKIMDNDGNLITSIDTKETITLVAQGNEVALRMNNKELGSFSSINLDGEDLKAIFKISPHNAEIEERFYDDHLQVIVKNDALMFINIVDLENYVAGVVQSEVLGSCDETEFYKIQAIITRTYAMANQLKHFKDGYNLCDDVHCQVYKSRNNTPKILSATVQTQAQIIVDQKQQLISAAFHSNSGGQTMNSEDVWMSSVPYLRSITDTFALGMRNSIWELEFSVEDWLKKLHQLYRYDIHNTHKREAALNFEQSTRATHFPAKGSILLKDMRRDFGFKSTFFSVRSDGNRVFVSGKGYGHGVGLSQESAIKMILAGWSVENVIQTFYQGSQIIRTDELEAPEE